MNGQIQYGSARPVHFDATPRSRRRRVAEPGRFAPAPTPARPIALLIVGCLVIGFLLAAIPRTITSMVAISALGGAWVAIVLALMLPSRAERAGEELTRRLGRFRHAVNSIGDTPTRTELEQLVTLAAQLELREQEISEELSQIRAALDALTLKDQLGRGQLPIVAGVAPLAADDRCHFLAPVRYGRRRADQFGHLLLTSGWLKYRGAMDLSVAWSEVAQVQRAGNDLIVTLQDSTRVLRFSCQRIEEAVRGGTIAEHLANAARAADVSADSRNWEATT